MSASRCGTYSQGYSESVVRNHAARTAKSEAAFLLPHLRKDSKILDCGCGPGSITCDFADIAPQGFVVGTDLSSDVLAQAEELAKSRNLTNVQFQPANILEGLNVVDEDFFDIVYCHQFLLHVPDPVKALQEMRRVCKPGGIVACREGDIDGCIFFPIPDGLHKFWDAFKSTLVSHGASLQAGRRLQAWAREAGFAPDEITKSFGVNGYATQEERDRFAGGFMDSLKEGDRRNNLLKQGNTEVDLDQMQEGWDQWRRDPDGWQFTPQGEVLCMKRPK